jgi:protoheme IX farnesyltransferase
MAIFAATLGALAWRLEAVTGDPDETPVSAPEPDLPPAEDHDPTIPTDPLARAKATAYAYFRLTKPRLMWLLCLVASAAMALAASTGTTGLSPRVLLATLGGGVLSIGASGTFNHVLERDIDRRMSRTSDRPLATDLVPVRNAVAFGVVLAAASLALFASVNWLAALLGLTAIVFYSVVYTLLLKPNTVQNTVIGGAAGALPALIGWVAVTGEIGLGGLVLAGVIFLWTPAHFYNLALAYKDDYERGGFPMMPVVRGETVTRKHILWYLGATLLAAAALATHGGLGAVYVVAGVAFGAVFLWAVVRLHYEQTESAAFRAFHASNAYLGALLLAVVLDTLAF